MDVAEPVQLRSGWQAALALGFERREGKTVLATRRHQGPLVVQKPLYPEGEGVCHAIVVHPPAGIAGGDELAVEACAADGAHALLTTPGAGRWYRSSGSWARQALAFEARNGACVEWLPQETIVFDGALADLRTEVRLSGNAAVLGWEVLCLGRTGSGERFARGECRLRTSIWRDERLLWQERGRIEAGGALMASPAGFGGRSVCGTLYAAATGIGAPEVARCREVAPAAGERAVTLLPGVLLARYLGDSSEAAKGYFVELWRRLRPAIAGREAVEPRIWRT
jgi:urease accessory protein